MLSPRDHSLGDLIIFAANQIHLFLYCTFRTYRTGLNLSLALNQEMTVHKIYFICKPVNIKNIFQLKSLSYINIVHVNMFVYAYLLKWRKR